MDEMDVKTEAFKTTQRQKETEGAEGGGDEEQLLIQPVN